MYLCIYDIELYRCICLSIYLSIFLSVYLQVWKRSYSARHPQFLNLTASKKQQVCEISSLFELDNDKNEESLRDILNFPSWKDQKRSNSARHPAKMES